MKNKIKLAVKIPSNYQANGFVLSGGGISNTICSRDWKDAHKILIRTSNYKNNNKEQ